MARIEECVQTLARTVAVQTTKITNIEQLARSLLARVTSLETHAASRSSNPDSGRSWKKLGNGNGSTATRSLGSHGPGHPITIRIRDADLIPPQALLMNKREVPFQIPLRTIPQRNYEVFLKESILPADNRPVTIHCQEGSVSGRLVFETRVECQTLWHDKKMMITL